MESTQSACCCKSNNLLMSKELFRIPYVKFTYSTRLLVNSFFINPKGDYWFLKANLFNKRNFAIIKEPDLKKPIDKKHIHHAFETETCIGCHVDFDLNKIQKHLAHMEECKKKANPRQNDSFQSSYVLTYIYVGAIYGTPNKSWKAALGMK